MRDLEASAGPSMAGSSTAGPKPSGPSTGGPSSGLQDVIELDACGLQCPGPIMQVYNRMKDMSEG